MIWGFKGAPDTIDIRNDDIPRDFERIPREGCILERYGGGGYFFCFLKNLKGLIKWPYSWTSFLVEKHNHGQHLNHS